MIDEKTGLWYPDKKLCTTQEGLRQEQEWLRNHRGINNGTPPSKMGLKNYQYGNTLHKSFYEGRNPPPVRLDSTENIEWYTEQIKRCIYGYEYENQRITGTHYFFLNFYAFDVMQMDKDGKMIPTQEVSYPYYSVISDYIFKCMEEARLTGKAFALMSGRGCGKEQPHYEVIKTPTGETTMGDVKVGDTILGSNGQPIKVTGKFPQGVKDVYRVHLSDGRHADCGLNHLWTVTTNKGKQKTLELKDMLDTYKIGKRGDSRYFINTSGIANYEHKHVSIDPYILGFLIGDGCLTTNVKFTTADSEIIDNLNDKLPEKYRINYLNKYDYSIVYEEVGKNPMYDIIRGYKLNTTSHNKYIPNDYMINSENVRMELLKGLMDSDGTCSKEGVIEFSTVSDNLADDVSTLCRSLGMKVTRSIKKNKYKDGIVLSHRIRMYTDKDVFTLKRKLKYTFDSKTKQSFRNKSAITHIEKLDDQCKCSCIMVDAEDHLYLTRDFIVTHNTFMTLAEIAKTYLFKSRSHCMISASADKTSDECFSKMRKILNQVARLHPTLALNRLKDTQGVIMSGQKVTRDGKEFEEGPLSQIEKLTYGTNPGASRGRRLDVQLFEEIGEWAEGNANLKNCIAASDGSWKVGSLMKCLPLYIGTGGSVKSEQAKDIFMNPEAYNILPLYDFGGGKFKKGTGCFIPSHYYFGGFWERTGVNDNEGAREHLEKERESKKSDIVQFEKNTMEYPFTVEEVFKQMGTNIFDQNKISAQAIALSYDETPKPEKGFLEWVRGKNRKIVSVRWCPNPKGNIEILEHPALGKNDSQYNKLYVAGVDGIDMGMSDSTSDTDRSSLACLIKKRMIGGKFFSDTSNLYVAKYLGRSSDVREDYDAVLKMAMYYNALVNIEYTKIGMVSYFKEKHQSHRLLRRPQVAMPKDIEQKQRRGVGTDLIGTPVTSQLIQHQDILIKQYILDYCDTIYFSDVLDQLRDYKSENRTKYDLVIAMGLCELASEELMEEQVTNPDDSPKVIKLWGYYTDNYGRKRYGVLPDNQQPKPIDRNKLFGFKEEKPLEWIDMSNSARFDDNFSIGRAADLENY